MSDKTGDEAAERLVRALQATNQAIIGGTVEMSERNVKFAQGVLQQGSEVLKSYGRTQTLLQELVELMQRQQGAFLALVTSATAAQEQTIHFAQNTLEQGIEVLKGQAESARALLQTLADRYQEQQEAFQTLAAESARAYMDFLATPLSYYQQALATAESVTRQGMETAQQMMQSDVRGWRSGTSQKEDLREEKT
jgi:uncharacterized phage infection (PIP) family protein YhgE